MIIAQISDTHIALDTPDADRRLRDFEATIADINTLDPPPDVIVHTGDVVHNGLREEYTASVKMLAGARVPTYAMVGNKDDRVNFHEAFASSGYLAPESRFIDYAIDDYPVRLLMLDSKSSSSNKGDFCRERVTKLTDMIDAETTRPVAVFTHHPPFEVQVGPDPINFETAETMSRLRQALQRSGRVIAVFSGHVHRGTAGHVDNIPATVMPSVATTLRKGDYPGDMETRPIYHIHRFDPAWGFSTQSRIVGMQP